MANLTFATNYITKKKKKKKKGIQISFQNIFLYTRSIYTFRQTWRNLSNPIL